MALMSNWLSFYKKIVQSITANRMKFFTFILLGLLLMTAIVKPSLADEADDIANDIKEAQQKLQSKESELSKIQSKASEISKKVSELSKNLNATQGEIDVLRKEITDLSKEIDILDTKTQIKQTDIEQNTEVRDIALKKLYINSRTNVTNIILAERDISNMLDNASYYVNFVDTTENLIDNINSDIKKYESDKKEINDIKVALEKEKTTLEKIAATLATQAKTAKTELAQISQRQQSIQQEKQSLLKKLSDLSAKQQEILGEKTETFSTSVGDVPTTGEASSRADYDPGFRKAFAGFSFGAPHRKGMSQYGAKGRADAGQNYEQILKAYYGDIEINEVEVPKNINTDKGTMELDGKYLKGLAEMPASWHKEALKAQAVAARTYALSYVGWRMSNKSASGKICTTENCQVWNSSKATSSSASNWHDAVSSTKAKVMVSKKTGEIFSAFYAATSGGYNFSYSSLGHTTSGGWDTKCGGKDCWTSDAYESKAGSPWFYKGWYKSRSGKSCSRTSPWLKEDEFADIVGAVYLFKKDSDNQKHLSQIDAKSCWGESIDDTWSKDDVKKKSGIEKIESVSVSYASNGSTAEVKIKTNKGELKYSGEDFRAIYNLRAPGMISIKSSLFNIEVKK